MKPAPFRYHRPASLDQALGLLAELPNARLLAGGQSIVPMLNLRIAFTDDLIDINRLPELEGIVDGPEEIRIGAMTRQRTLERSAIIRSRLPLMVEALEQVGHSATRNRGTLGGSLCHLDPAAELPVVATAYQATLRVVRKHGVREVAMEDFPRGIMTPGLDPDEMLESISFRPWPTSHGFAFLEFARRHGDFAIASAAALILLAKDGTIARATLVLGGVAAKPILLDEASSALVGKHPDQVSIATATTVIADIDALDDPQIPAWYRRRIGGVMARRALEQAAMRAAAAEGMLHG